MKGILFTAICLMSGVAQASTEAVLGDFLVKLKPGQMQTMLMQMKDFGAQGGQIEAIDSQWMHLEASPEMAQNMSSGEFLRELNNNPAVEYAQPNYKLQLIEDYKTEDPALLKFAQDVLNGRIVQELLPEGILGKSAIGGKMEMFKADPAIPSSNVPAAFGADPLLEKQWNMKSIHAVDAWKKISGNKKIVVAVIDTGVDYTHQDLVGNMWHNTKEIPGNSIDDDGNGFVDDVVGWDFVKNDNKPYDTAKGAINLLVNGGNPGHGTHCAGNIGAVGNNSKGISGVAPQVSIMALRFLDEKGRGTTAGAVKAINYAVANGANVLSNSWGSAGEDPREDNQALKDAIKNAEEKNVLFVAAAGNGRGGKGYDNDDDPRPSYPASYDIANIISVAAIDEKNQLGVFSNFGVKTVHLGAPGVAIFSTIVGSKYSANVVNVMGKGFLSWSGTSMATPHVAGAAAMVLSAHPNYTVAQVKAALLNNVEKIPALEGKTVTGGKLNVEASMR